MNIKLDRNSEVQIEFSAEADVQDAMEIEKLVASPEWSRLFTILAQVRNLYETKCKRVASTVIGDRQSSINCATWNGFDQCYSVAGKIIAEAHRVRESNLKILEELENETEEV